MLSRKIMVATLALFTLGLIYLMPNKESLDYSISKEDIEYVYTNTLEAIYLLDAHQYVTRVDVMGCDCDAVETAKDSMQGLIIDGKKEHIIPNGFRALIPSGTEVRNVELKDKILTINFSRELLDINEKYEEKMIEAIVYTLTSIDGIDKVIIQVEGEVLDKLPKSGKSIPTVLDRSYGINKVYDLATTRDIDSYTVYYVSHYNDYEYYVPVTKYVNKNKNDKIKVIIDELSTSPIYEDNLMSYVNANVSLINVINISSISAILKLDRKINLCVRHLNHILIRPHDQGVLVEPHRGDLLRKVIDLPEQFPARVVRAQFLPAVALLGSLAVAPLRSLIVADEHSIRLPAGTVGHTRELRVDRCDRAAPEIRQIDRIVKKEHALRSVLSKQAFWQRRCAVFNILIKGKLQHGRTAVLQRVAEPVADHLVVIGSPVKEVVSAHNIV